VEESGRLKNLEDAYEFEAQRTMMMPFSIALNNFYELFFLSGS
jgi:hypothetical protein